MCYNVEAATIKKLKYAKHRGDEEAVKDLQLKLDNLQYGSPPLYQVGGFEHPKILVFTDEQPFESQLFSWGLIPAWVKDEQTATKLRTQTLNARGESIWEKPSFRESAKGKRCLVYVDAFYEYHHQKSKSYPFHVSMKDESPMVFAGLWQEWVNKETGEIVKSFTIVTTEGSPVMSRIHNNPKAEGARMPVILPKEKQDDWLRPCRSEEDKVKLNQLLIPFDDRQLQFHTVHRLKGKDSVGNTPEADKEYIYPELNLTKILNQVNQTKNGDRTGEDLFMEEF
jgi:putative SOS response-associated peptidase YedK